MNISIRNVKKSYGKKQVLRGVSLEAESGKCIGILGGNGCGKSTLLSILAGIQPADGGSFFYNDRDLFKYPRQRAELIGYIPQGTPLMEELTAKDNLSLWYDKKALEKELSSGVLKMLGIDGFLKVPVSKMSGGMKKRLSIGCAIAKHPPILLLDEPMAALDLHCKQEISRYLQKHKESGGILLLVTHDVMELALCDEWYIFKNGVLEPFDHSGDPADLAKKLQ